MTYREHKAQVREIAFEYWDYYSVYFYEESHKVMSFCYKYGKRYGLLREFDRKNIPYSNYQEDVPYSEIVKLIYEGRKMICLFGRL